MMFTASAQTLPPLKQSGRPRWASPHVWRSSTRSDWHFDTKKQLPYQLLSDPQRALIGALGAADGNKTKRSHFVFEKGGKLLDKKIPVKPADRWVPSFTRFFVC